MKKEQSLNLAANLNRNTFVQDNTWLLMLVIIVYWFVHHRILRENILLLLCDRATPPPPMMSYTFRRPEIGANF